MNTATAKTTLANTKNTRKIKINVRSFRRGSKISRREPQILSQKLEKYTKDPYILDLISNGLKLEFKEFPFQDGNYSHPLSVKETEIISQEI